MPLTTLLKIELLSLYHNNDFSNFQNNVQITSEVAAQECTAD